MSRHTYHDASGAEVAELEPGRFYRPNGDQVPPHEVTMHPRGLFCATRPSEASPNYIVSPPRNRILTQSEIDYIARQRKLSPQFPTLAEAATRRRQFWQTVIARGSLLVAGFATSLAIFTDTPALWSYGAIFVGFAIFGLTCFVAAASRKRHD